MYFVFGSHGSIQIKHVYFGQPIYISASPLLTSFGWWLKEGIIDTKLAGLSFKNKSAIIREGLRGNSYCSTSKGSRKLTRMPPGNLLGKVLQACPTWRSPRTHWRESGLLCLDFHPRDPNRDRKLMDGKCSFNFSEQSTTVTMSFPGYHCDIKYSSFWNILLTKLCSRTDKSIMIHVHE